LLLEIHYPAGRILGYHFQLNMTDPDYCPLAVLQVYAA
jgi:hypothetical protein